MVKSATVRPLQAYSARDSFAKLVKFLTRQDVRVEFRGYQPRVETDRSGKVVRMVLPELNDNPSKELLEAMHGYLDHECGHIFVTPFKRMMEFAESDSLNAKSRFAITNIIEDIRLEKLLPRTLPGTKENLERMYETFIPDKIAPPIAQAKKNGVPATTMITMLMVPAFRALAGQVAFQRFMDDNNYWPDFAPLLQCLPGIPRELREMETFDDVEKIVERIIAVVRPNKPQPDAGDEQDEYRDEDFDNMSDCGGEGDPDDDEGADSDEGDAFDDAGEPSEDDDGADEDGANEESDDTGGEGHGDGEGTDDGSDEEAGDCSGDADDDDDGTDTGTGEGADDDDGDGDLPDADGKDGDPSDQEGEAGGDGKGKTSITDALKQLEPTQRKAIYAYKRKRLSIAEIAEKLELGEEETKDVLREARRNLNRILNGE